MTARRAKTAAGYSLIELVMFIVILGILGAALFSAFGIALQGSGDSYPNSDAARLAQERMELILAQRRALGFAGFTAASFDPCTATPPSTQAVCAAIPAGYTVSAAFTGNWGGDANYKTIAVIVTGTGQAALAALVGNY